MYTCTTQAATLQIPGETLNIPGQHHNQIVPVFLNTYEHSQVVTALEINEYSEKKSKAYSTSVLNLSICCSER